MPTVNRKLMHLIEDVKRAVADDILEGETGSRPAKKRATERRLEQAEKALEAAIFELTNKGEERMHIPPTVDWRQVVTDLDSAARFIIYKAWCNTSKEADEEGPSAGEVAEYIAHHDIDDNADHPLTSVMQELYQQIAKILDVDISVFDEDESEDR